MKAYRKNGKLVIEIGEDDLCGGVHQIPGNDFILTDREKFLNHMADTITKIGDDGDRSSVSSMTRLIDECIESAVEHNEGVCVGI